MVVSRKKKRAGNRLKWGSGFLRSIVCYAFSSTVPSFSSRIFCTRPITIASTKTITPESMNKKPIPLPAPVPMSCPTVSASAPFCARRGEKKWSARKPAEPKASSKPTWDMADTIDQTRPCFSLSIFVRINTSRLVLTKGSAAKKRKPNTTIGTTAGNVPISA